MGQTSCCCQDDGGKPAGVVEPEPLLNSEFAEKDRSIVHSMPHEAKVTSPMPVDSRPQEASRFHGADPYTEKLSAQPVLPLPEDAAEVKETMQPEEAREEPQQGDMEMEITLTKGNAAKRLGLDVRHLGSMLEVQDIHADGFVAAHNATVEAQGKEVDAVKVGDKIIKVNDVAGHDDEMVRECVTSNSIRLRILRPAAKRGN
mmetsp:Transcript_31141/g.71109  ORF Transcript_31141/g.71109 Transcript_31141/m.71109 type:complete len:202 (+) Transcript_31141:74-679(+)